jgi:hypothetical protein
MKKILFTNALYIIFSNIVLSQDIRYGISIGWGASSYSSDYPIDYKAGNSDFRSKSGFKVAFLLECPISDNIFIVPEFVFTQRGVSQDWFRNFTLTDSIFDENNEFDRISTTFVQRKGKDVENINYLQMPVNVMYKIQITSDVKFSFFLGAYIGYALSGKVTSNIVDYNTKERQMTKHQWHTSDNIKFGSGEKEYKKFDMGLNVGAALEYADFFLSLQYNKGIIDKFNHKYYSKNNNIGISLGCLF